MDERTMFELLEIYDAVCKAEEIEVILTGDSITVGPEDGILGKMSYITEIIARFSPVYGKEEEYEKSYFRRVLEDGEMDNHRKARILLGLAE